jgi:hypothetical protein
MVIAAVLDNSVWRMSPPLIHVFLYWRGLSAITPQAAPYYDGSNEKPEFGGLPGREGGSVCCGSTRSGVTQAIRESSEEE